MLQQTVTHRYTGERVTFLETAAETGGAHLLIEVELPPGGDGPPLHSHLTFVEEFRVLEGALQVRLGRRRIELRQGSGVRVEIGQNHTFSNPGSERVRFTVRLTPPSQFEESMRIHYGLMDDGRTNSRGIPRRIAHAALILWMQDTLVAGIPRRLQRRLLGWLVRWGDARGEYTGFETYLGRPLQLGI